MLVHLKDTDYSIRQCSIYSAVPLLDILVVISKYSVTFLLILPKAAPDVRSLHHVLCTFS